MALSNASFRPCSKYLHRSKPARMTQEPKLNELCQKCQNFTLDCLSSQRCGRGFAFHDINGLLQSAKEGCHFCNLMVAELPKFKIQTLLWELEINPQHSSQQLYVSIDDPLINLWSGARLLRLSLRHWRISTTKQVDAIQPTIISETTEEEDDSILPIIISDMRGTMVRRGTPNTGSHENLEMIKAWIEHCEDDHSICKTSVRTTARLPTRLLQIEKSGESFKIKLCLSSGLSPSTSYATLSHVWGSGSLMRLVNLVNENLLRYQQDIPLAKLPQTFADAIQLTNALGLSYLWIDSLCIIQDSTLDWEVESTTMCDVYRGSTINIAASASVDCNGGLYRQRNPLLVTPCIIDVSYKRKEAGAREGGPYALMCETACDRDPFVDEPLSGRAWAVQERILAPRTVYFTARKIYFACCKKMTSDVDPCSLIGYNGFKEDFLNTWTSQRPILAPHSPNLDLCLSNWKRVVQQYTHGQLSYESDKLVAIAGLAKHMQRVLLTPNITYLAGLWSFELIDWLMWRVSETLRPLSSKAYRAPSWSWASVEGEVEWRPYRSSNVRAGISKVDIWPDSTSNQLYGASVVEARTNPTSDPFGSVHGGYIQIRGHLCSWRHYTSADWRPFGMGDNFWDNRHDDEEYILADYDRVMFFVLRAEGAVELTSTDPLHGVVEGLILQYTRDKKGQYKRIGAFEDRGHYFLTASRSFCPAEHLFLEVNGGGRYTIEII